MAVGRFYFMEGRAEAEVYLEGALTLDAENPEAHYGLGQLWAQQGRDIEAAYHFEQVLAHDAEHADAWYSLAQVYARLSKDVESRKALARFAALQGRPPRDLELILSNPTRSYPRAEQQHPLAEGRVVDAESSVAEHARHFVDITANSGVDFVHTNGAAGEYYIAETLGAGVCSTDFDGDGLADLYLVDGHALPVSMGAGNRLYRNGGDGFFSLVMDSGAEDKGYGMGCAVADYDADGDLDLYVSNWGANVLYRNDGALRFVAVERGIGSAAWSTSAAFFDCDLDGDLDLYAVNYLDFRLDDNKVCDTPVRDYCSPDSYLGQSDVLYRNDGAGYADMTRDAGLYAAAGKGLGVATSDYDADGDVDLDLAVSNNGGPAVLLCNDGDGDDHWLQVELKGARSVGAKVWVEANGRVQLREFAMAGGYLSQGELVAHFGLGNARQAVVRVVWPDGWETRLVDIVADQRVVVD